MGEGGLQRPHLSPLRRRRSPGTTHDERLPIPYFNRISGALPTRPISPSAVSCPACFHAKLISVAELQEEPSRAQQRRARSARVDYWLTLDLVKGKVSDATKTGFEEETIRMSPISLRICITK